ncbi:MAG TPA: DUF3824 domain-containing protein [Anaerolineales bacterium]|nr:DUF3824 domain-containing protein [Anaerolineales bacterium]
MFKEYSTPIGPIRMRRGLVFGVIIIFALLAFEIFNYSTTDYALHDLLGDLSFLDLRWSTILALAFCGIDFAGIARIFTPEDGAEEPAEVWYLFGAWLLGATMNAMLTWWGVSIAILNHQSLGSAVVDRATLLKAVPIFVAVLVWLSRVLLIGTFSIAGDRLFSQGKAGRTNFRRAGPSSSGGPQWTRPKAQPSPFRAASHPAPKPRSFTPPGPYDPGPNEDYEEPPPSRAEPTYHPVSMQGRRSGPGNPRR